jgi:hypothetical protein
MADIDQDRRNMLIAKFPDIMAPGPQTPPWTIVFRPFWMRNRSCTARVGRAE